MQLNQLLLPLAVPAASSALRSTAAAVHGLADSFSEYFSGDDAKSTAHGETELSPSGLIHQLQGFLQQIGLGDGPYAIDFQLGHDGSSTVNASGVQSSSVLDQLNANPDLELKLRQIASAIQQQHPSSPLQPGSLTLSITEDSWSATTGL